MTDNCKQAINHISRLQGQLEALKKKIDAEAECEETVQLALSSARSFDGLRGKIIQGFIQDKWFADKEMTATQLQDFEQLLKLIKS